MTKEIKEVLTFKPSAVARELLLAVADRARQIMKKRYGLEAKEPLTLEAIGQGYGITRERVRQIEEFTLKAIKKSSAFAKIGDVLNELQSVMEQYGGVVHEQEFLNHVSHDQVTQNQVHFLLVLGDAFFKLRESDDLHPRWTTDDDLAKAVHASLKNLCQNLSENDLLPENEIIAAFLKSLHSDIKPEQGEKHAKNWLKLSKEVGQSPIGEWGLTSSPNVRVRGIRDYAFLVMRKHGSPMHFTEVAKAISSTFNHKANPATCHNELIKDKRFVLVGRGMYALAEWGYTQGIVRDVIRQVLKKQGPLTQADVITQVMKERYVKPNTVLVNLKNPKHFKKTKDGKYVIV